MYTQPSVCVHTHTTAVHVESRSAVIQGRAKLGVSTPLYQYRSTGINQKQPCNFRASGRQICVRFQNLAPCRVTDSRPGHSIVLEHKKTDHSRGSEVTRPKFEGQQLPPAWRCFRAIRRCSIKKIKNTKFTNLPGTGTSKSWI